MAILQVYNSARESVSWGSYTLYQPVLQNGVSVINFTSGDFDAGIVRVSGESLTSDYEVFTGGTINRIDLLDKNGVLFESISGLSIQVTSLISFHDLINGNQYIYTDGSVTGQFPGALATNDTLYGSDQTDFLKGNGGRDTIFGYAGDDFLYGDGHRYGMLVHPLESYGDTIDGGEGNDRIFGDFGNDTIHGGAGNDFLVGGDAISLHPEYFVYRPGFDTINGDGGDDIIFAQVETEIYTSGFISPYAYEGGAVVDGGEGNDLVIINVAHINDSITLDWRDPTKQILLSDGTSIKNVERLHITTGDGADVIYSGSYGDIIHTGGGNDVVHVGGVALSGVANLEFREIIDLGDGNDVLYAFGYTLDSFVGLNGGEGQDTLFVNYEGFTDGVIVYPPDGFESVDAQGGAGNDRLVGGELGQNKLFGKAGDDYLIGGARDDIIDGGTGADGMIGGGGSETYYIDNVGDYVIEAVGGGRDVVNTTISYTLTGGQEIEELRVIDGAAQNAINLTGNDHTNKIIGNAGANALDGRGGNDTLFGEAGNDTYFVDRAGDQVFEVVGRGRDVVNTTVAYTLAAGQEIEELRVVDKDAKTTIALTGNEFANKIVGDAGNNRIDGGGGADSLYGGAGSDTYLVDNAGDQIFESKGGGWDAVVTTVNYTLSAGQEIEELRILQSAGDAPIHLTGNALAQNLIGNNAANTLNGGWGNDVLTGRGEADTFVFSNAPGTGNIDRITDFATEDMIQFSSSIFTALAPGQLDPNSFKNITTGKADADDRILYKQATGELFYDADGSGSVAKVKIAVLDNKAALFADDFLIV